MFDIGWTELLIIAVVAIIVVGPKDLPRMLRSLGRYAGQLKRTASDFRSQFDEALKESELDELRTSMNDMRDLNPVNQIRDTVTESLDPLKSTAQQITSGIEGKSDPATAGTDETATETPPAPAKKPARKKPAAAKPASRKTAAKPKPRRKTGASAAKAGG